MHKDRIVALRTRRYKATGAPTSSSIQRTYSIACARRSPMTAPCSCRFSLRSFHRSAGCAPRGLRGRKIVDLLAVQAVTGRDLDGLKAVENVELGQRQAVDAGSDTAWRARLRRTTRTGAGDRYWCQIRRPARRSTGRPHRRFRSGRGRPRCASCRLSRCQERSRSPWGRGRSLSLHSPRPRWRTSRRDTCRD